jgi:hypothetical protein
VRVKPDRSDGPKSMVPNTIHEVFYVDKKLEVEGCGAIEEECSFRADLEACAEKLEF